MVAGAVVGATVVAQAVSSELEAITTHVRNDRPRLGEVRRTLLNLVPYPSGMASIVVTRRLPGGIPGALTDRNPWVSPADRPLTRDELITVVSDCEGLLCMLTDPIDGELLDAAPALRVVSQMAVGVDNIDVGECLRRGIRVGHTPDVLTETTADTAFALLAAAVRRIPEGRDAVIDGRWGEWDPEFLLGGDLYGTTLGIVGLGRIGQAIARRASGFSMRLLYHSRHRKPAAEIDLGIAYREFDRLLTEADHVVISASLDGETRGMFDSNALRSMKRGATLVNVARGGLVDHDALTEVLIDGPLGAAALDVTDPEPIPQDHPLVGLANCLIVPHIGSASVQTRIRMALLAVDNLVAGLEGREMRAELVHAQAAG